MVYRPEPGGGRAIRSRLKARTASASMAIAVKLVYFHLKNEKMASPARNTHAACRPEWLESRTGIALWACPFFI